MLSMVSTICNMNSRAQMIIGLHIMIVLASSLINIASVTRITFFQGAGEHRIAST